MFDRILKRHLREIFVHRATLAAPVIRMNETGVFAEIALEDIRAIASPRKAEHEGYRRQEQWARYYLGRALPVHKWYDRECPHVRGVKAMITRAVAMAASVPRAERRTHMRSCAA